MLLLFDFQHLLVEVLFSFFHFVQFNLNLIFVFLTTSIYTFLCLLNFGIGVCSNSYRFGSLAEFGFKDTLWILNDSMDISVIVWIIIVIELIQLFLVWSLDQWPWYVVSQHRWRSCPAGSSLLSRWPYILNRRVLCWLLPFITCISPIWIKLIRLWFFPLNRMWFILFLMTRLSRTIDLLFRRYTRWISPKLNSLFSLWRILTLFLNIIWPLLRFEIFSSRFICYHTILGLSQPFSIMTEILELYFTDFQHLIIFI